MVSALRELRRSVQMCLDLENTRSTATLVAGMARMSQATKAMVGKTPERFYAVTGEQITMAIISDGIIPSI
jgi:hypothetical protein